MTIKSRLESLELKTQRKEVPDAIAFYFEEVGSEKIEYKPNKNGIMPFVFSILKPVGNVRVTRGK